MKTIGQVLFDPKGLDKTELARLVSAVAPASAPVAYFGSRFRVPTFMARWLILIAFAFSFDVMGADYVFVFDTSGSMTEPTSKVNREPRIRTVQQQFLEHLTGLEPDSRIALISFNTGIKAEKEMVLRTDADRQLAAEWVNDLERQARLDGNTYLWRSLRRALQIATTYAQHRSGGAVRVWVLTDGQDNDPLYRGKSPTAVLEEMRRDFPDIDRETIQASLVTLGLKMDLRSPWLRLIDKMEPTSLFRPIIGWQPQPVRTGQPVTFSNMTGSTYRFYDWWVGGIHISFEQKLTFRFTNSGPQIVRLLVTGADGTRQEDSKTIEVLQTETPVPLAPEFSFLPAAPEPKDNVQFNGKANVPGVVFSWQINGQEFATTAQAKRSFPGEGQFEVTLVVRDATGRTEQARRTVRVFEPPIAVAFAGPSEAKSGQEVAFVNETQPADRVTAWTWEFGDGTTSSQKTAQHKFANDADAPRSYNVVLRATSRSGRQFTSKTHSVTVLQNPPAPASAFKILEIKPRVGTLVNFRDASSGPIDTVEWNFNGEGRSINRDPEFRFETPGSKTIALTVRGPGGQNTAATNLTVLPREQAIQVNWLGNEGQSMVIPQRIDFGLINPIHLRNGELDSTNEFEMICPPGMPPGISVVIELNGTGSRAFEVAQRVTNGFRPMTLPARVSESARFRLGMRTNDVIESEHECRLTLRLEGADAVLNGKPESLEVDVRANIGEGKTDYGWLIVLLLVAVVGAAGWWFIVGPPEIRAVDLTLAEVTVAPNASLGSAVSGGVLPTRTLRLDRANPTAVFGKDPDNRPSYDVGAPAAFITFTSRKRGLGFCDGRGAKPREIRSGEQISLTDAGGRPRLVLVSYQLIRKEPRGRGGKQ